MRKYGRTCAANPILANHFAPNALQKLAFRLAPKFKRLSYRYLFPPAEDQLSFGTCVANATAGLLDFFFRKRTSHSILSSRRAFYAQAKYDYTPSDIADDGLTTDAAINVWINRGWIPEDKVPYPADGDVAALLAPVPNEWGRSYQANHLASVDPSVTAIKMALAKHGPVIIGLTWANEWESGVGPDGMLPPPATEAGGHCVLITGYDDARKAFEVRNSWGLDYGDGGYVYLPYSYATAYPAFWPTDLYTLTV